MQHQAFTKWLLRGHMTPNNNTVEHWFIVPPRKTGVGSRHRRVWHVGGKWSVFHCREENHLWFEFSRLLKNGGYYNLGQKCWDFLQGGGGIQYSLPAAKSRHAQKMCDIHLSQLVSSKIVAISNVRLLKCLLSKVVEKATLPVRSFGMIWNWISDPRSLGSLCIKGTGKSTLSKDSPAPLLHNDPGDLGSLTQLQIIPKERTLQHLCQEVTVNCC